MNLQYFKGGRDLCMQYVAALSVAVPNDECAEICFVGAWQMKSLLPPYLLPPPSTHPTWGRSGGARRDSYYYSTSPCESTQERPVTSKRGSFLARVRTCLESASVCDSTTGDSDDVKGVINLPSLASRVAQGQGQGHCLVSLAYAAHSLRLTLSLSRDEFKDTLHSKC